MGRINRGILGGVSGKVANIIGGSWKGIAYLRSMPLSVSQPNTAAQVVQKETFSEIVAFAKALLLSICQPLWNRLAVQMSGYNYFIKVNSAFFDENGINNYADLKIAVGNATGAEVNAIDAQANVANVIVDWIDNSGTGTALATDLAYCLVINETQGVFAVNSGIARSVQVITVALPADVDSLDVIHVYLAFKSANGLKISGTAYSTVDAA